MSKSRVLRVCVICSSEFYPWNNTTGLYCSKSCSSRGRAGTDYAREAARKGAQKRGDAMRDRGEGKTYRKRDGRHEHRVVAERKIGRPLRCGEVVHHIDGNIRNNAPENLEVLPSQSAHIRTHAPWRQGSEHGMAKLTEAQVEQIRERRAAGERSADIARDFAITRQHVSHVVLHGWRHV